MALWTERVSSMKSSGILPENSSKDEEKIPCKTGSTEMV